jgi:ankyrin repeat protein
MFKNLPSDIRREVFYFLEPSEFNKVDDNILKDENDIFWIKNLNKNNLSCKDIFKIVDNIFNHIHYSLNTIINTEIIDLYVKTQVWNDTLFYNLYNNPYIDKFANLKDKNNDTVLMFFVTSNLAYIDIQSVIKGVDINAQNSEGNTALMLSIMHDKSSIIKILLEAGADVHILNKKHETALDLYASISTDFEHLNLFLSAGADINRQDIEGYTALMQAARNDDCLFGVEKVFKAGADINIKDKDGDNALSWLCIFFIPGKEESIRFLVENGININNQNKNGYTPLMQLLQYDKILSTVGYLLSRPDIDLELKNNRNRTAYDMAVDFHGSDSPITMLIKAYQSKNKKRKFLKI